MAYSRRRRGAYRRAFRGNRFNSLWRRGEVSRSGNQTTVQAGAIITFPSIAHPDNSSSGLAMRRISMNMAIAIVDDSSSSGTVYGIPYVGEVVVGLAESQAVFENSMKNPAARMLRKKFMGGHGYPTGLHMWIPRGFNMRTPASYSASNLILCAGIRLLQVAQAQTGDTLQASMHCTFEYRSVDLEGFTVTDD